MDQAHPVEIAGNPRNKGEICREILTALPRWFAIPEAVEAYVREAAVLPMLVASAGGGAVGFLSLKDQSAFATEAYVLGVRPEWHRKGVGRRLFAQAEAVLRQSGILYFTVKTVAAPDDDPVYGATRKFYEAMGFVPLETFPTFWHARNPCLFMIKSLG